MVVCLLSAHCLEKALACTEGHLLAPTSESARTAAPAIKDAYFLCLVNEISF